MTNMSVDDMFTVDISGGDISLDDIGIGGLIAIVDHQVLTDNVYFILVSLLSDKHGYRIMQSIEKVTGGEFVIGPASLYTNLKKLLKAGLIEEKAGEKSNQKVYGITALGLESLKSELQRKEKMILLAQEQLSAVERAEIDET